MSRKNDTTSNKDKNSRMVLISVHIPRQMLEELDRLVQEGRFPNRSEAIRTAIRDLLLKERERTRQHTFEVTLVPGR